MSSSHEDVAMIMLSNYNEDDCGDVDVTDDGGDVSDAGERR